MRCANADDSFAIEIEHVRSLMFAMSISFGAISIGGEEGWGPSSLQALADIKDAVDADLRPEAPTADLVARLQSDENHDRHLMTLGENFDGWGLNGFIRHGQVVLVVQRWHATDSPDADVFVLDRAEYLEVISEARAFYDAHATRS